MNIQQLEDIGIPIVSCVIPILYHIYFFAIFFTFPKWTNFGRQLVTRKKWLNFVMFTKGEEIIGVQTFRNAMMASSFLASLSSALAFYSITLAQQKDNYMTALQMYGLSVMFFISFLLLAFNVRYILHTSYLVSARDMSHVDRAISKYFLSPESRENRKEKKKDDTLEEEKSEIIEVPGFGVLDPLRIENVKTAERNMVLATICYTLGVRFIFFSIPIAIWSGSGVFGMLIASCLVVGVFIFYDHV
eukprot:gene152-4398_t